MVNDTPFDLDDDVEDGQSTSHTTSLTSQELQKLLESNRANAVKQAGEQSVLDDIDVRGTGTKQPRKVSPAKIPLVKSNHPAAYLFEHPQIEEDLAELLTAPQKDRVKQARLNAEPIDMTTVLTAQQLMTLKLMQEERKAHGEEPAMKNWWEMVPVWGWVLITLVCLTLFGSLILRLVMPNSKALQFQVGVASLLGGMIILGVVHVKSYMRAVQLNDKLGLFDIFMKPITVWQPTFLRLPDTKPSVILGGWSLSLLCGGLIVGGSSLMDATNQALATKEKEKEKTNLLKSVVSNAQNLADTKAAEDMTMEEALNEFTGITEEVIPEPQEEQDPGELDSSLWPKLSCLIIGYVPDPNGDFQALVLASAVDEELKYVGTVDAQELTPLERAQLFRRLSNPALARPTPLLPTPMGGKWLNPLLMCRVAYESMNDGTMTNAKLVDLLADIE